MVCYPTSMSLQRVDRFSTYLQVLGHHRYTDLLVCKNDNVVEFDYVCRPSSGLVSYIYRCGVYEDDKDCKYEEANDESDEDVNDESNGDLDVRADGHVSSF